MNFKKTFKQVSHSVLTWASAHSEALNRCFMVAFLAKFCVCVFADAGQADMSTGVSALGEVKGALGQYIEPVRALCYALAGIIAIGGAISVYIKMNNEEQDVKNILVLRNAFEKTRKQIKVNTLSINALGDNLNFPMFAKLTLKKT